MFKWLKKIDYRHYICIVISVAFVTLMALVYNKGILRLVESFKDLWQSFKIYIFFLFDIENDIQPTVINFSSVFDLSYLVLPINFEEFKVKWVDFWQLFFVKDNFTTYLDVLLEFLSSVSKYIIFLMPIFIALIVFIKRIIHKENNNYNKKTIPLKIFLKVELYIKFLFTV